MTGRELLAQVREEAYALMGQSITETVNEPLAVALAALDGCVLLTREDMAGQQPTRIVVFYRDEDGRQRYVEVTPEDPS